MISQSLVVGVDLGTETTKVVLGEEGSFEIVRNDVGGHTTPTVVAFVDDRQPRQIGLKVGSNPKNSVSHLNRLFSGELEEDGDDLLAPYYSGFWKDGQLQPLTYQGKLTSFSNSSLVGMLLSKIKQNAQATYLRQKADAGLAPPLVSLSLACPPNLTAEAQQELMDAAFAAGIDNVQLLDRSVAYQAAYSRKFPEHVDKYVMVVDMGHAETVVAVLGPSADEVEGDQASSSEEEKSGICMKVLACHREKGLGAGTVDVRLWQHFQSTKLPDVTPDSRGGQRLLVGMTKLKMLLSQLPEGNVTVENVGTNETDVVLEGSRNLLVELCSKEVEKLTSLVERTLKDANVEASQLFSLEVVGGGCRMPWVKDVLQKATQLSTLSYTLDDTSAAMGAALETTRVLARRTTEDTPSELQVTLRQKEETMALADEALRQKSAILNQIEAHILGLRSAKHEKHGNLLPDDLFTFLDASEDWLFSEEADTADLNGLQAKWKEIQEKTDELSKEFNSKIEEERNTKEAEMEAEVKLAQKEREGEKDDEEDHDNRRLPKKRRMEIVMKNKKEGGELFSDGNYSKSKGADLCNAMSSSLYRSNVSARLPI